MKTVKDRDFVLLIGKQKIQERIQVLANLIQEENKGSKPLFLGVLNGSFMFLSDLMKEIEMECQLSFLKINSYQQLKSTGKLKELIGLNERIEGRNIIIVEDIVDTGLTMEWLLSYLGSHNPASIKIVSLLLKPKSLQKDIKVDYCGFEIENDFVVGYGLDYDGYGRNLPEIYVLNPG